MTKKFVWNVRRRKGRIQGCKAEQVGSYTTEIHGQMATIRKFQMVREGLEGQHVPNAGFFTDSLMYNHMEIDTLY